MKYETMKSQVLKISENIAHPSTAKDLLPTEEIKVESDTFHADYIDHTQNCDEGDCNQGEDEDGPVDEPSDSFYGYKQNYASGSRFQGGRWPNKYRRGYQEHRYNNANPWRNQGFMPSYRSKGPSHTTNKYNQSCPSNTTRQRQLNQPDRFGRPRQCRECLSVYHVEDKCPELDCNITLLTDEVTPTSKLLEETIGCIVLDSGCIHTVCGTTWLDT